MKLCAILPVRIDDIHPGRPTMPAAAGLSKVEMQNNDSIATVNQKVVASLVPHLKTAAQADLAGIIEHLNSSGRCLLLLALTKATMDGKAKT